MKVRLHWTTTVTENRSAEFELEKLPAFIGADLEDLIADNDGVIPVDDVIDINNEEDGVDALLAGLEDDEHEPYSAGVESRYIMGVEFLPEVPAQAGVEPSSRIDDPVGDLEDQLEERNG